MAILPDHDLGDLFAADAFDLAALGLMDMDMDTGAELPQEDGSPHVAPAHDMESLEFFLWMEEEVDKEQARRQAKKNQPS